MGGYSRPAGQLGYNSEKTNKESLMARMVHCIKLNKEAEGLD
ncbi:MAG TPA: oxidative damage protection protein, partial [Cupriavidus sp.]|nr:oxidative damage protection protein [Cupriavidus sp.]